MSSNILSSMLKAIARKVLPTGMRQAIRHAVYGAGEWRMNHYITVLRRELRVQKPGLLVRCLDYTVRINNGPNFYILYKDIFLR